MALSLYRQLLRQEYRVFQGDGTVLQAALNKTKQEFSQPLADATQLEARLNRGREVLQFMQRNLVQGVHNPANGSYRLRMTPDHEINDRIPPQKRGRCC